MTIHSHFRQEQIRIARYRDLEREVTDPLALCLLHIIVEELEADLENAHDSCAIATTSSAGIATS